MSELQKIAPRLYQAQCQIREQMEADEGARREHVEEFNKVVKEIRECEDRLWKARWEKDYGAEAGLGLRLSGLRIRRWGLSRRGPKYVDIFA